MRRPVSETGTHSPRISRVPTRHENRYVTDLFGKMVWEARARSSGVVLYVCAVPSMKKGETVANIGVVADKAL
jgi:hypothetical protein